MHAFIGILEELEEEKKCCIDPIHDLVCLHYGFIIGSLVFE